MKYTCPGAIRAFNSGKNCATIKVAIQLAAKAQLCTAPTASEPTSSDARMKGMGPRPRPKEATNRMTATALRTLMECIIPMASRRELRPIPVMESKRQRIRPSLSARGAQDVVMMMLTAATATLRIAELAARREERSDTPYMTMLLMPVNCWAWQWVSLVSFGCEV